MAEKTLFLIAFPNDPEEAPKVLELTREQDPMKKFDDAHLCGNYRRVVLSTPFQEGLPFTKKEFLK